MAGGEMQRFRLCYLYSVSFWRPLWIAYVEVVQTVSSVLSDESIDDGRNVMEIL
jgi:hypothetical protein